MAGSGKVNAPVSIRSLPFREAFWSALLSPALQQAAFTAAYRILRNSARAEDAVQEAYLSIHRKLAKGNLSEETLPPIPERRYWLLRIVINQARNMSESDRRRQMRHVRASQEEDVYIYRVSVRCPVKAVRRPVFHFVENGSFSLLVGVGTAALGVLGRLPQTSVSIAMDVPPPPVSKVEKAGPIEEEF